MKNLIFIFIAAFLFSSCYKNKVTKLEKELAVVNTEAESYKKQYEDLKGTNASLLDRMADLSVVSKAGAENISKSLENISKQYSFIENLSAKIQSKDSINLALVTNLKRSLMDMNDEDVYVEVREGIVHISIADKLLFTSGSSRLGNQSSKVLEKIASVINDHNELDIMVQGHTDNVPIVAGNDVDNWDLSVKRATAVVRKLQSDYYVAPERMTASGRSEYAPKADNSTSFGRKSNRRTEIIITPKLDQFFKLLETPEFEG